MGGGNLRNTSGNINPNKSISINMEEQLGSFVIFREEDKAPLKSQNTWLVAAMAISGIPLAKNGYSDTAEVLPDGKTKRVTTWLVQNKTAAFDPIREREDVGAEEFSRRFLSKEWCEENADHPIAYLRNYMEAYQQFRTWLHDRKPSALIRKGKRFVIVPADAPESEREKLLSLI